MEENVNNFSDSIDENETSRFTYKLRQPVRSLYLPFKQLFDTFFAFLLLIPSSVVILIFMILIGSVKNLV